MKSAVDILGVSVDALTAPEALVRIRESLGQGKRLRVVTVNPEMVVRAQRDEQFRQVLATADLRLPDGIGLAWAARYLGRPLRGPLKWPRAYLQALWWLGVLAVRPAAVRREIPETVPGSELARDLAGMCEEFGYRLFLLGSAPGVADRAGEVLQKEFPELQLAGTEPGDPSEAADTNTRQTVNSAGANVLLVAYTSPKQEYWLARNLNKLPAPVAGVGVGGTFDYLAGAASVDGGRPAKVPPRAVRRRGFEWLWRLFTQPSRWRRIVTALPVFVRLVVRHKLSAASRRVSG